MGRAAGQPRDAAKVSLGALNGPNGFRIEGIDSGDQIGRSLHLVGDMNGDGLDDYVIGASGAGSPLAPVSGEAYVIFGTAGNPAELKLADLNGQNGFRIAGAAANDRAGESVSGAGDVNGDGLADVIVGAPGASPDELLGAGITYILFGASQFDPVVTLTELNGGNGFAIHGSAEGDRSGSSVSGAGDVNGDGLDDVLLGAPEAAVGAKAAAGLSYVIYGRASFPSVVELSSLDSSLGLIVRGAAAESRSGNAVSAAGDVNRDGLADFLVGAWQMNVGANLEAGAVYCIFGSEGFGATLDLVQLNGQNGFRLTGGNVGDRVGQTLGEAGDVNGDGYADIIAGAPAAAGGAGRAYLFFGQANFAASSALEQLDGTKGVRLLGGAANGFAGIGVAGAGDVNSDGLGDVLVGASGAGAGAHRSAGESYLVLGQSGFAGDIELVDLAPSVGITYAGVTGGDQAGQAVGSAGDVNGDGYDDFLVAAPKGGIKAPGSAGYVYLVMGGPTLPIDLPVTHTGTTGDDNMTGSQSADVMLGDRGNDQIEAQSGDDVLKGGQGNDLLNGGPGSNRLIGGNGRDIATYSDGSESITGDLRIGRVQHRAGDIDLLYQMEGLIGSPHDDTLRGDARANLLNGGPGNDMLTGGPGNDVFMIGSMAGNDTIVDFEAGPDTDDVLDVSEADNVEDVDDLDVKQQGPDTVITLPDGSSVILKKVTAGALHAEDFRFGGEPEAVDDHFDVVMNAKLAVGAPGVLGNDLNPAAQPMTARLVDDAGHGTVILNANGSFEYQPQPGFAGTDAFTYRANNGRDSNIATVSIVVVPLPPEAVNDNYVVFAGETLAILAPGLLGNDVNPAGLPVQITVIAEPQSGALDVQQDGSFTYEPAIDHGATDSFTYRISAGGLQSNMATVSIEILDNGIGPIAVDDSYQVEPNVELSVEAPGLFINDLDPGGTGLTAVAVDLPAHGMLNLNADGSFTYLPNNDFVGVDSFTYQAANQMGTDTATVTITVGEGSRLMLPLILRN